MSDSTYKRRVWLSHRTSSSTEEIITFHGKPRCKCGITPLTYLQINDDFGNTRLHRASTETMREFIEKIRTMANAADDFANWLEECENAEEIKRFKEAKGI